MTQVNIHTTMCTSGWTTTVRPPQSYTTELKREQIVAYGYPDHVLGDYEEDHLVSLEIGGAPRDPKNLWPEPYIIKLSDGRSVGARVKDLIENRLHDLVCAGKLSLALAQHEEATDWITAWFALDGQAPAGGCHKPSDSCADSQGNAAADAEAGQQHHEGDGDELQLVRLAGRRRDHWRADDSWCLVQHRRPLQVGSFEGAGSSP